MLDPVQLRKGGPSAEGLAQSYHVQITTETQKNTNSCQDEEEFEVAPETHK